MPGTLPSTTRRLGSGYVSDVPSTPCARGDDACAAHAAAQVSIDGLTNITNSKALHKIVYCLNPPRPFYVDPPLPDDCEFTRAHVWDSPLKYPRFNDPFHVRSPRPLKSSVRANGRACGQSFREVSYNDHLTLIMEVKELKMDKKNKLQVTTLGWCALPIFMATGGKRSAGVGEK